jgi:hypothetical protein
MPDNKFNVKGTENIPVIEKMSKLNDGDFMTTLRKLNQTAAKRMNPKGKKTD